MFRDGLKFLRALSRTFQIIQAVYLQNTKHSCSMCGAVAVILVSHSKCAKNKLSMYKRQVFTKYRFGKESEYKWLNIIIPWVFSNYLELAVFFSFIIVIVGGRAYVYLEKAYMCIWCTHVYLLYACRDHRSYLMCFFITICLSLFSFLFFFSF